MNIEESLEQLPDVVADKLMIWRLASLKRESQEATLYVRFKAEKDDRSATEIKALINCDRDRVAHVIDEIKCESEYNRFYERLMSAKKLASLRTAF